MTTVLHIEESARESLAAAGWDRFELLMDGAPGVEVSAGRGTTVQRLTTSSGKQFYLKRRSQESIQSLLVMLLQMHRPESGPLREVRMVRALTAAGFDAMEPVAWGERRTLGIPQQGFVLVKAVEGSLVADLYDESDANQRRELMNSIGGLVGRLHAAGFPHPVRLKDLIQRPDGTMVLIDRETSKPWQQRVSLDHGIGTLARSIRRTLRDGHRIGPSTARAFLTAYQNARPMKITRRAFYRKFFETLRAELRG